MRPSYRALAGVLLVAITVAVVGYVALHKSDTAIERSTSVQREVKTKAPKTALAATDKKATTAKKATDKVSRKVERQVIKLDRTITVLGKAGVNGLPGKNGSPGPPGRDAVVPFSLQDVIAGLSPKLADRIPTAAQVVDACGSACVGPAGRDGVDGRDAPPVTDAQLDAAVARYCDAHNQCQGAQGVQGATGPQGLPGADGAPGAQGPPGVSPTQFVCQPPNPDGTQNCTAVG